VAIGIIASAQTGDTPSKKKARQPGGVLPHHHGVSAWMAKYHGGGK